MNSVVLSCYRFGIEVLICLSEVSVCQDRGMEGWRGEP